ncbi:hypothetical protein [Pseudomonas sp. Q1]|uniref:hypothetical protein n=1 Tax=Pseudomonas sp. Q1 TaxID=2202823 RepID=UPI001374F7B8|nr:hypothetical protein [Pseudomonas sp. Q1]NCE83464.1 hypothetical protein [Pseudomonas sp. Q1]
MEHDFRKLKQALTEPADGPYALAKMRELLLEALEDWPNEKYRAADYLLPWGRPIRESSRHTIAHLLTHINDQDTGDAKSILKPMELIDFLGA